MGSTALDTPEHTVASNDCDVVTEAVNHLISLGHRRIGLIAGPHGFRSARERRKGFENALSAAGIKLPRSLIADGNYTFESGQAAADRLLDLSPRPTAIFASNDEMAAAAMHAARRRGMEIPKDLSIIGFDDTAIASHIWPPMTTVHWPIISMGRSAALKLLTDFFGDELAVEEPSLFPSTLIHRASVAPPRDD
jgi:LacI family transcriptional regulator